MGFDVWSERKITWTQVMLGIKGTGQRLSLGSPSLFSVLLPFCQVAPNLTLSGLLLLLRLPTYSGPAPECSKSSLAQIGLASLIDIIQSAVAMGAGLISTNRLPKMPLPLQRGLWLETISEKRGLGSKTVIGLLGTTVSEWVTQRSGQRSSLHCGALDMGEQMSLLEK